MVTELAPRQQGRGRPGLLSIVVVAAYLVVGIFLGWQIVSRAISGNFWNSKPEFVLALRGDHAPALLRLAELRLPAGEIGRQGEEPWALRTRALLADPLSADAIRELALAAERAGDGATALDLMMVAGKRSIRDPAVNVWLMRRSLRQDDFAEALHYADALERVRPNLHERLLPVLVAIANHPTGARAMVALLAGNPPWRTRFLTELPSRTANRSALLDLFLALEKTAFPPTPGELGSYMRYLVDQNQAELAYYTWLHFLPPERLSEAGYLYNGGFDLEPSGFPFDWMVTPIAGAEISFMPRLDVPGKHALAVDFLHQRVPFRNVIQMVILPPARYRMTGSYQARELRNKRGMAWRIYCEGGEQRLIGESEPVSGRTPAWREFALSFEVPAKDCRAQSVRLELTARIDAESEVSGSIWYDDLRIARLDPPAAN